MTQETALATVKDNSFLDDRLNLDKMLRAVSEKQAKAIKTLVEIIDTSKSEEMRYKAAVKLLDLQVLLAEKMSTDQINRLIAEFKFTNNPTGNVVDLPGSKNTPLVDFTTVQQV